MVRLSFLRDDEEEYTIEGGLDEDEFKETYEHWDDLDSDERSRRWQEMDAQQQEAIAHEYQNKEDMEFGKEGLAGYHERSHGKGKKSYERDIFTPAERLKKKTSETVRKLKGEEVYRVGMDDSMFKRTYKNWDDFDEEEQRKRWRKMNADQREMIAAEHEEEWEREIVNRKSYRKPTRHKKRRHLDEEQMSRLTVSAEEWNEKSSAEKRELLWDRETFTKDERAIIEKRDEYETDDVEINPERFRDKDWYDLSEPEQVAIAENPDYSVEEFGYSPTKTKSMTEPAHGLGLLSGGVGSGAAMVYSEPLRQSPNPETQAVGWMSPVLGSLSGYAVGAGAGGGIKKALKKPSYHHDFISKTVENAYESQQEQQQQEAEA